jgi:GT2 family glycosyltransferase/SAM-dependent methyltransferase
LSVSSNPVPLIDENSGTERAKWDAFYRDLPVVEADPETRLFNQDFTALIDGLLPGGGTVLEAGCGAGWQSLALAQSGRYRVSLLDFSVHALEYARRVFGAAGASADFRADDIGQAGAAEFDLVFNSGVLEHHRLEEQARLLRGMASRSRNYVMALVPNSRCYWYWLWRARMASRGQWPWGRETPLGGLDAIFEAAGVRLLGHAYLGETTTEYFIRALAGVGTTLTEEILAVHRSAVIPAAEKAYLVAALGTVKTGPVEVPASWISGEQSSQPTDELRAALLDALSLGIAAEQRVRAEGATRLNGIESQLSGVDAKLALLDSLRGELEVLRAMAAGREQELAGHLRESETRLRKAGEALRESEKSLLEAEKSLREHDKERYKAERRADRESAEAARLREESGRLRVRVAELEAEAEARQKAAEERSLQWAMERKHYEEGYDNAVRSGAHWAGKHQQIQQQLKAAEDREAGLWRQLSELESAFGKLQSRAESLRRKTVAAFTTLSGDLEARLGTYRSQRAWQVMLAFRQAYTMLARNEDGGRLAALGLPWRWLNGKAGLSNYDLHFPDPWRFAPDGLQRPMDETVMPSVLRSRKHLFDIVILSIVDFEFRFQRPQQIAVQLAERGHRVYWLSPTRTAVSGGSGYEVLPLRENLWELHLPGTPVDLYGGHLTGELADRMMTGLDEFFRKEHVSESCAYLQFPFWRKLALRMRERHGASILYDMMDDWAHWSTPPLIGEPVLADERELFHETDVFVVTSRAFAERHKENQPAPLLVPNGADYEFFHAGEPAGWLSAKPKPIVGYFGAISTWFDEQLMAAVVKLRPQYSFVFIGQVHELDVSAIAGCPNAGFLGERNYRELAPYLAEFDVCLIPFRMNKVVEGVDPVKMYEYFSQGKPVVATPMRELEHLGGMIYLAGTPEEFAAALDAALSEPAGLAEKRMEYARQNTWAVRTSRLVEGIVAATPLVSILVVTYNSEEFLDPFLDSIERNTSYANYEVVFVDNNSSDGSARLLKRRAAADARIRVFTPGSNLGFAGGNNYAAREARGEWFVVLNPDTIVTPGWIGRLMAPFRASAAGVEPVGAVAPVTNFSGNETKIDYRYTNLAEMEEFALDLAEERHRETMALDCVPLLCALFPRRLWEEVGELDERFTVGMFEDDDFCVRVRRAGYRIVTAEDCFLHHFGNGSFKKLEPAESLRIFHQNREKYESKWNIKWKEHRLRPGVRPVHEEPPMMVSAFVSGGPFGGRTTSFAPVAHKLHPQHVTAGVPFQAQPNGHNALAVACERATPYTFVQFGGELLATSYAGPNLLTALLRPELTARPGEVPVRLVSDLGVSESITFYIE